MIESPLLDEVRAQSAVRAAQNNILHFLVKRFGAVSSTHDQTIRAIVNLDVLSDLIYAACVCKSLDEFSLELSKFASRN